MPIEQTIWIQEQVPVFIWKTGSREAQQLQSPREREQHEGKALLAYACDVLQISMDQLTKDEHGKPYLADTSWEFSITHTLDYLAAVFHPHLPVGIDLEKPQARIGRIIPRLCTAAEVMWAGDDLQRQCFLWSAKEAMYKLYGKREVDFKKNLSVISATQGEIHMPKFHAKVRLIPFWGEIPGHILVIALPEHIGR